MHQLHLAKPHLPLKRMEDVRGLGGRQQRPGEFRDWGRGGFPKVDA